MKRVDLCWSTNGLCQPFGWLMPAIWLKPTSGSKAENSGLDSRYMHHSSKTELHLPNTIFDRIWAWGTWRLLVVKLVRLPFKRRCWANLGAHLRAIKGRISSPEPEGSCKLSKEGLR